MAVGNDTITINVNGGQGAVTDTTAHAWSGTAGNGVGAVIIQKKLPYIVTPAPFILPNTTNNSYKGEPNAADPDQITQLNPYGCFPYLYLSLIHI